MQHDYSLVFETDNEYWERVLEIFEKNEKYPKKKVSNRNLHHKFPRSFSKMLGEPVDNDSDNLISLSLADHFLVHYYYYLLAKKGFRQRMATAFTFMAKKCLKYMTPDTAEQMAKDYEEARAIANQHISEIHKGKGHPQTEETKIKIRKANLGKHHSNETKQLISDMNKQGKCGMLGKQHSNETKRKMSTSAKLVDHYWLKDRHPTIEHKKKLSEIMKGPRTEFGIKFKEHFGWFDSYRPEYKVERNYYNKHNKCSWES